MRNWSVYPERNFRRIKGHWFGCLSPHARGGRAEAQGSAFQGIAGDILTLPFPENCFDKTISVTALEFIADGPRALRELFRVTRPGGVIVVATLNSLSPWATRRKEEAQKGHTLFQKVIFRSPEELVSLAPVPGITRTAVPVRKEEEQDRAAGIEQEEDAPEKLRYRSFFIRSLGKAVEEGNLIQTSFVWLQSCRA